MPDVPMTAPTDDREFIAWCRDHTLAPDMWPRLHVLADNCGARFPEVLEIATLRLDLADARAQLADRQRLFDLVRYCRHKLHDDGLISNKEFSQILTDGSGRR